MVVNEFFLNLKFQNALKCMIQQLSSLTLTISSSSPKYSPFECPHYSFFIMFLDICERYTYTFYERNPPHNTIAEILDREITDYDVNVIMQLSSKH